MKLRLLVTKKCYLSCEGCCNKDWDLDGLIKIPEFWNFPNYEEIIITGGEPMMFPDRVLSLIDNIRITSKAKIYMYTASVVNVKSTIEVLKKLDGMTVTLHNRNNLYPFDRFQELLPERFYKKSLFLNIFKDIKNKVGIYPDIWSRVKTVEWIKNCPLPKDEVFNRLPYLWS